MTPAPEHNLNDLLVSRHLRAGRGAQIAVIDDLGGWSYDELDRAAAGAARRLHDHGVGPGDRVAILLDDSREWCAAFLGATRLGAVAAPIEPKGRHLASVLADLAPCTVVAATQPDLPPGSTHCALDAPTLLDTPGHPIAAVDRNTPAYMVFSSGSTGRPKGVVHAHGDLHASIDGYSVEVLDLQPGDRCHSVAKLFASLGFGNGFFRPLGRGATIVLHRGRPNVRTVMQLVAHHGVTILTAVPTFWSQCATYLDRHPDPGALASVRLAVSSGDSLPAAVLQRVTAQTSVDLLEGLGCSECSNIVLSTRPGDPHPGTLGRPVAGVTIELRDDRGAVVADGEPGRLWIRSPSNTTGYWRRPAETADVVHGEWIRMGDVLRCDGGVYRHLGRVDDIFKVDARWVSPVEVESALHEHPSVQAAAVVACTDAAGLTRVAAAVCATSGDTHLAQELRRHVAHRLDPYLAPVFIRFLEDLPRGATGKVDRAAVRAIFAD